ncbi:pentatricopeptide repeat-containing protein At3g20730 [Rutidosis leptorrhynchoides]|uniref:pentatricopeptide repeat-containing protein At3g20730 n=1 Tax=Rutidosis leptorrhynchoides TaxID=125765 RepID=UPI003A993EF0
MLEDAVKLAVSVPKSYSRYLKILQACVNSRAIKHGRMVHCQIIANGFNSNVHLGTKLIIFYSRTGDAELARRLFDQMPERNIVSWTAMISGYTENGFYENALVMFANMCRAGYKANQFTYGSALRACTSLRCLSRGEQIQGCIVKGRFVENLFVKCALLDLHSKCGKMEDASYLFETMSARDVVSWNAMINGFAAQGLSKDSFLMFSSMMRDGGIPDRITLGSILRMAARSGDLVTVNQIHKLVIELGFEFNNSLTGSLLDAYAKCGSMDIAYYLYRRMPEKDIISYTALITGFSHQHDTDIDSLELFKELKWMQMGIDDVLLCSMLSICADTASLSLGRQIHALAVKHLSNYDISMSNSLIDMYSKSGEIEDARRVFDEMTERNVITWTSLIAGYGKNGYGTDAMKLLETMEEEGLKPNDVTFLSLLFACSHAGLTNEGWKLFSNMVSKYDITPGEKHLSCLVDLLARKGWLEEAYNVVDSSKPGTSILGAILGGCTKYGDMSIGQLVATRLLDPEYHDKSV